MAGAASAEVARNAGGKKLVLLELLVVVRDKRIVGVVCRRSLGELCASLTRNRYRVHFCRFHSFPHPFGINHRPTYKPMETRAYLPWALESGCANSALRRGSLGTRELRRTGRLVPSHWYCPNAVVTPR